MRRMIWVRVIAAGLAVLLLGSVTAAAWWDDGGLEPGERAVVAAPLATPGAASVSGTIRHNGAPVAGVEVLLSGEFPLQSMTTGADGVYTFGGIATGSWAELYVRPPIAMRLEFRNTRFASLTGNVVRDFDLLSGYRLQGSLYEPNGSPTSMALRLQLEARGQMPPVGDWIGGDLVSGGFDLVVRPGIYELKLSARPMPYFLPHTAVDMRAGDVEGLTVALTDEIPMPFPVEPPDASKISIGTPDAAGYATVTGSAGAVGHTAPVLIVNLNAANMITTTASMEGAFSASLYAPPGSTLLIKTDRMGGERIHSFWWNGLEHAADTTIFNVTPLPGTMVRAGATPAATDTEQAFSQVGGFFRLDPRGWAGWWMTGSVQVPSDGGAPGLNVAPGDPITVTATVRVTAPALSCSGTVTPAVGVSIVGVMPLFGSDGRPLQSKTQFNAQLFTPTGLPIEHEAGVQVITTTTDIALSGLTCLSEHVFEGHFEAVLDLPGDLREGIYRPSMLITGDVPLADEPVAVVWYHLPEQVVDLPTIRVGDAAPPRIPWMLLSNVPVNGSRGVVAREDIGIAEMTTRVRFPPHKAIVPRVDERTGEPIVYRMEPDANWIAGTERRLPAMPHVPLKLPGGSLVVEILKPDGGVDVLETTPISQSLVRTPTTPGGDDLDEATGQVGDIFQLYAGETFEYAFEQYGDHVIYVFGEVEDIYKNAYPINKTYDVTVARVLDIDPGQLPTTPYVVGDAFSPGLHVFPQVPADVAVDLVLMEGSKPAQLMEAHVTGKANRFGVFYPAAGTVITMTEPGEFRVDITAVYTDSEGTLWAGAMTWGSVVASPAPQIAAHGRRGMDYKGTTLNPGNLAWFVGTSLPPELVGTEVYYPYFTGDVHWGGQGDGIVGDSIHTILTVEDLTGPGEIYSLLRSHFPRAKNCFRWPPEGCTLAGFDERVGIDEAPLFITTATGEDPVVAPEAIDLWGYWYGSSERPDVHVREIVSEDGMGTAYWRFDDTYGYQIGEPADGDHEGDMKWEFGGLVLRETGPDPLIEYAVYSSFWVLLPNGDAAGTRVTPPFRGANGTSIDGGPLLTLKGEDIDVLFLPKGVRPGDVLEVGDTIAFTGHVAPPLDSRVNVTITSPSGTMLPAEFRANRIGWVHDPDWVHPAWEPGRWTVDVHVEHDRALAYAAAPTDYNTGTVLGTSGRYEFYVVEEESPKLFITSPDPGFVKWTTEGIEPIHIIGVAPEGSTTVHYTVHDKGIVMDQGTVTPTASGIFTVTYDAEALNADFPMLSLVAHEGRWEGLADEVAINMLALGGEPRANTVTLIGEEAFIGNEVRRVYLPFVVKMG